MCSTVLGASTGYVSISIVPLTVSTTRTGGVPSSAAATSGAASGAAGSLSRAVFPVGAPPTGSATAVLSTVASGGLGEHPASASGRMTKGTIRVTPAINIALLRLMLSSVEPALFEPLGPFGPREFS